MRVAVLSGGCDPLHEGHIAMINAAAKMADRVIFVLNTDEWLIRKKGYLLQPVEARAAILRQMRNVDEVRISCSEDDTVCADLREICTQYSGRPVLFLNGGDRTSNNTPERRLQIPNLKHHSGVGGTDKVASSSVIWQGGLRTDRLWGHYVDHLRTDRVVFKTLHIQPYAETSYQRHIHRGEVWFMASGSGQWLVDEMMGDFSDWSVHVPVGAWHKITAGPDGLVLREMQYGYCKEEDIERV